jgi:hypothetical protein
LSTKGFQSFPHGIENALMPTRFPCGRIWRNEENLDTFS